MESYNEYHKDPAELPFLKGFQNHWQPIRDEFTQFMQSASPAERHLSAQVMGPKSKTITTRGQSKYTAFGILFQGLFIEDYVRTHQITYPDYAWAISADKVLALREKYFPQLAETIAQTNTIHKGVIRNVYFGCRGDTTARA